jgi:hypothetical protein
MIEAMLTHAGTPAEVHVPSARRNTILPARLIVGNEVLLVLMLRLDAR